MTEPLVSVIMNGHNASKYVAEAIDSVLAQTYKNWEIVFWDNCSDDATNEIIKKYNDPRVRYFYSESFTPLGQARNSAIEKSNGEFIAFLDCDDLWLPQKLALQIPLFQDKKVGLVYSDTIFFNELGHERQLYNGQIPCEGNCFRLLLGQYFLSMETVVIRRITLENESPYFDPRFDMIEEADLFRRIAYKWNIAGIPEPLAKWRVHGSSWTFKHPHLLKQETEVMLKDFRKKIQDFDNIYVKEISQLKEEISFSEAKNDWINGSKWPLVNFLIKSNKFSRKVLALIVVVWPASMAIQALRFRGEVLPASFFRKTKN